MNKFKLFLIQFFSSLIFLSIIGIIISIYIEEKYNDCSLMLKVCVDVIRTISIAVLVAGIFSWISSSQKFLEKIQVILKKLLVDKEYLQGLDDKRKLEVMKALFRSDDSIEVVPNIDEYYNFYIAHCIKIANENVRTNYSVNAKIRHDSKRGLVVCEKRHRYKLFRNEKGFYEDIKIGVAPSDIEFGLSDVKVSNANDVLDEIKSPVFSEVVIDGEKMKIATIKMDKFYKERFLHIDFITCEVGFDHWYTASIQLAQPTYGLTYLISCEDDIVVKTIDTFSQGASFDIKQEEKGATIIANQWINPGSGICVVVGKK